MPIVFEPLIWSPETLGTASSYLPSIKSFGLEVAGDWGAGDLPAMTSDTEGVYGVLTTGTSTNYLPRITAIGFQAAGDWGLGYLPIMNGAGLDLGVFVPQSGSGVGVLPNMQSYNSEAMYAYSLGVLPKLSGYGLEAAGDWGVGLLPNMLSQSINAEVYGTAYFSLGVFTSLDIYASTTFSQVDEILIVTENVNYDIVYAVVEHMIASADMYALGRYERTFIETLSLRERVQIVYDELLTDIMTIGDDLLATVISNVALFDTVSMSESLTTQHAYIATIVDMLTISSLARSVILADITDPMVLSEALTGRVAAMSHLVEAMLCSDTLNGLAVFTVDLTDVLIAEDSMLCAVTLYALIEEGIRVSVGLSLDGVPYVATVMNTATRGITEYNPYNFNSVATFNGETYGAGPTGLSVLSGSTDNGTAIDAYARTALARIAGGKMAQVDSAYLGYSSDGTVQMKTIVTAPDGSKIARVYQLNMQNADATRAGRIKLGRGVKSAYWAFEVSNVLGSDFTIDVIEVHVLALSRRI